MKIYCSSCLTTFYTLFTVESSISYHCLKNNLLQIALTCSKVKIGWVIRHNLKKKMFTFLVIFLYFWLVELLVFRISLIFCQNSFDSNEHVTISLDSLSNKCKLQLQYILRKMRVSLSLESLLEEKTCHDRLNSGQSIWRKHVSIQTRGHQCTHFMIWFL